jgi:hypothetical protein
MTAPNNTFYIKQNDTLPVIQEYLRNADGTAIDLTTISGSPKFHMRDGAGTVKVNSNGTVISPTLGLVQYAWTGADTNTAGAYYREWEITFLSGKIVTTPNFMDYPVQISANIA